jgi:hypothetical protein
VCLWSLWINQQVLFKQVIADWSFQTSAYCGKKNCREHTCKKKTRQEENTLY